MSSFNDLFTKQELRAAKYVWLRPSFWAMNNCYDAKWDARLRELIESGINFKHTHHTDYIKQKIADGNSFYVEHFTKSATHMVYLGPETVWISNYPYGTFNRVDNYDSRGSAWSIVPHRPSRATIYLLRKLLKKQLTDIQ